MAAIARTKKVDFAKGPVWKSIVAQAIPLTIAQLVHLLYNVVDRIYLGHLDSGSSMALTGVGLAFPVITLIMAVTALFGVGGVPLFSMARGGGDNEKAAKVLQNSYTLLLISAFVLTALCYIFCRPILFAFGASEDSYIYAREYLNIYLIGTVFTMLTTGLNGYINAQGFPRTGMGSIIIGAVCNIILDPIFIFLFRMGIAGAALATVISQAISAMWVLHFLTGSKTIIALDWKKPGVQWETTKEIIKLGTASFIMQATNCLVQMACNSMLQSYGGDLYVGIMTVLNSVREIFMLPVMGLTSGALPVISFNYGAREFDRVRSGVNFNTMTGLIYTAIAWTTVVTFPHLWLGIFSNNADLIGSGSVALKIYFFGFVFMSFQFAGQSTFQALGDARHAIFFSLLRKVIIVVPLTLLLPRMGFGVNGVFIAEPVSNFVGGLACYLTMRMTAYRKLKRKNKSDC